MNRRDLIKNAIVALTVSILPEILRPSVPQQKIYDAPMPDLKTLNDEFMGIIPEIRKSGNNVDYRFSEFSLGDVEKAFVHNKKIAPWKRSNC